MVLSTCCTHEEKQRIWAAAQVYADQFARDQPNIYVVWDAVPNHISPFGVIIAWWGGKARSHKVQCLLEGTRKCIWKPVNYEKVKEVTQEEEESPVLFQGQLVEAF